LSVPTTFRSGPCLQLLLEGVLVIFTTGLQNPEGPVSLRDGSWLIVEGGAERGCITWVSADGNQTRVIAKTGRPNGLAVDSEKDIWVAESKTPSLLRVSFDGKVDVIATECDGEPFLLPNDLCFGPDGFIYMTDSGVLIEEFAPNNQVRPDYENVRYDGRVYRIDPANGKVTKLDSGIKFTNGIAFDSQGRLYANESATGAVYRYLWKQGAATPTREFFGNVKDPAGPPGWRGPDGMAFGVDGKLYVAVFGQQDVTVLDTVGSVCQRIATRGKLPTNIAFAQPGNQRIYVTEYEFGAIETFDVATDGLALWTRSAAAV
jgi:gluconolactonase